MFEGAITFLCRLQYPMYLQYSGLHPLFIRLGSNENAEKCKIFLFEWTLKRTNLPKYMKPSTVLYMTKMNDQIENSRPVGYVKKDFLCSMTIMTT